jgi:hypothetical protein
MHECGAGLSARRGLPPPSPGLDPPRYWLPHGQPFCRKLQCGQNRRVADWTAKEGLEVPERKIGRDAGTGRFIPLKEAERKPKTTVVETVKIPTKKGKK